MSFSLREDQSNSNANNSSQTSLEFSVFTSNTLVIDKRAWTAYLSGQTVQQAIASLPEIHLQTIITQYRNFELLDHFLSHPKTLATQLIFTLSAPTRMDAKICRELLGKKLTHRIRKDLDDISSKTHRSILLCRRVFDNLKRVTKRVEDSEDDLIKVIMGHFLLGRSLAEQYAHIIFINHYRLDTTKKKLASIPFADYEYASPKSVLDDLDSAIVEDARLLKTALFNHKDVLEKLRLLTLQQIPSTSPDKYAIASFKLVVRNVLAIGASLTNSKEVRDLFLTIIEKVSELCTSFGWTAQCVETLFDGLVTAFCLCNHPQDLGVSVVKYQKSFSRLFQAIKLASVRFLPGRLSEAINSGNLYVGSL